MNKFKIFLTNIITIILIPLLYLSLLGGFIAAIVLAFETQWTILAIGIIYIIFGWILASLLLLPTMLLGKVAEYFFKKPSMSGTAVISFVSQFYIYAIIFGLSYMVFGAFLNNAPDVSRVILVLWSFVVSTSPWIFLASKEEDNEGTQLSLTITVVFLLFAGLLIIFGYDFESAFDLVRTLLIIPIIYSTWLNINLVKNKGDFFFKHGGGESMGTYQREELSIFVLSCIAISRLDDKLASEEIHQIRKCFQDLTGENISKKLIKQLYVSMDNNAIDYWSLISQSTIDTIPDDKKILILHGCCQIATSEGGLSKSEIDFVYRLSRYMSIPEALVNKILNEYIKNEQ